MASEPDQITPGVPFVATKDNTFRRNGDAVYLVHPASLKDAVAIANTGHVIYAPSRPTSGGNIAYRNGLAAVRRRGARVREVSLVDAAGVPGSRVLSISAWRPGTSHTAAVLAEAAVRGTGAAAMLRLDAQAERELAVREADELVAAGARWAQLDHVDDDLPAPAPTPQRPDGRTWQQRFDSENERLWLQAREDDARREYSETLTRRQRAELNAERHAAELDAVWRAHR